ncbi:hypothetical protein [Spirosoma utsteinense]|uniref:DNA-binding beta-propeller fold protein YncE n=1 Tax=Spirosoma utsteinense TaxID=2585773 RepID=A0ABR6W5B1_9BACT|nr:hypothetical protein [Spirosoma utsteinense]MBC3785604.1 DNA-binding beta-propeller fold protein YncE [Spirosoma utsteinense]MBC3791754.1 DNA-binding beta-propeller fold protein YncE [Spirosoma utsteinense]
MNYSIPLALLVAALATGCQSNQKDKQGDATSAAATTDTSVQITGSKRPALLHSLPEMYNTPDGMALAPDSSVILSVPNFGNPSFTPVLLRMANDTIGFFFAPPKHPDTKHAAPMDLAYGPDGNLYYADNQWQYSKERKSRLMRIRIQNGKPTTAEMVVEGFRLANAVVWKGNTIYVTDSQWDTPEKPRESAILHFSLSELNGTPVKLKAGFTDPHILTTFTTQDNPSALDNGADGLDYDSKGNFFTGGFGDGIIYKMTLKPDGSLAEKTKFATLACVDGLIVDRTTDQLYVCDSKSNAIRLVSPDGKVSTLAENGDTNGSNGLLDQPAEVLLKGKRLFIANYDMPEKAFRNQRFDAPHTLSVIELDK